jgi:pyruvate dehydrogenase E1 component alpha subunit
MAAGTAFAYKAAAANNVVIAFAAEDEIAASRNALSFACELNLPVIYVQLPGSSRAQIRNFRRKIPSRLPEIPVDCGDAIAIYRVASEAIDKARRGAGGTLIRCVSYHLQSADHRKNSPRPQDPIAYMRSYLEANGLWSDQIHSRPERT